MMIRTGDILIAKTDLFIVGKKLFTKDEKYKLLAITSHFNKSILYEVDMNNGDSYSMTTKELRDNFIVLNELRINKLNRIISNK